MTPPDHSDDKPALLQPRRARQRNWLPSLVWLIPIVAAIVGLTLVAKILVERGPVVTVSFRSAEGLEAGKTKVKYKDVEIGQVQSLKLAADRSHVLVGIQLNQDASGFNAEDTRFWVVRPRIAASGISGLGTLLSGAHIGADAGASEETKKNFVGLEQPPIVTRDASGRQFVLHTDDLGSLDIGSPIFYRRIKVGQVVAYDLDSDGRGVTLRIFVNAPYDKFVTQASRFWHASGFDMELNASGFKLHTQALSTVVLGGIAFRDRDEERVSPPAKEGSEYALVEDESAAMKEPDGVPQTALLYFDQSLRGLQPGATVDFRGVVLGEVKSIGVEYDKARGEFRMPVLIQIYPDRLGRRFHEETGEQRRSNAQLLRMLVKRGMRAQLRNGNLLTGQLYVAIDFFPKAKPAQIDPDKVPLELPTIPGSLDELQQQLSDIAGKLSKVPFDEIGRDLQTTLKTLNKTLTTAEQTAARINNDIAPEMQAAMKDARKTLNAAERTLSDDAPLQSDIRQTMQELSKAAAATLQAAQVATAPDVRIPAPQVVPGAPAKLQDIAIDDDRHRIESSSRLILVIEDDTAFAMILRDLAHEMGFQCVVTHSANEGVSAAEMYRPSAILMDMNLPDFSGLGVLDQIKRNPKTRHIPVHVVSVADYSHEALERGAIGYALKPVQREELLGAIRKLEAKFLQGLRHVLVVEDDARQLDSIRQLLAGENINLVGVRPATDALARLRETTFDCMVMDLNLPDLSGYQLLEKMAEQEHVAFPPVIVYTGRSLSAEEEQHLRRFSRSIIIKDARSPERLLDEVTLFLHQVETTLPPESQRMLKVARDRETVFEGRRILVVEDDVRNIFALSSVLEPKGMKVDIARNGREALDALQRSQEQPGAPIDLVLMDIMMPEMDGLTAMREIRKQAIWKRLPIIALTAKAMKDDQEKCLAAGANDYIAKPLDVEKLLSLVRVWMPK